jgi:hypothetical protein
MAEVKLLSQNSTTTNFENTFETSKGRLVALCTVVDSNSGEPGEPDCDFFFFLAFECFKTGKFTFNNYTFMDTSACIGKAYEVTIHKDDLIDIHNIFSFDHTIAMDVLKSRPNRVEVTDNAVSLGMLICHVLTTIVNILFQATN